MAPVTTKRYPSKQGANANTTPRTVSSPSPKKSSSRGVTHASVKPSENNIGPSNAPEKLKKVFVHVKNPDDQQALVSIKQISSVFPGLCDMVLVLGADKQSAIKMPFRVDGSDEFIGRLVKVLGEDAVVLK